MSINKQSVLNNIKEEIINIINKEYLLDDFEYLDLVSINKEVLLVSNNVVINKVYYIVDRFIIELSYNNNIYLLYNNKFELVVGIDSL